MPGINVIPRLLLLLLCALPCQAGEWEACTLGDAVVVIKPSGYAWSEIERGARLTHTGQWFKTIKFSAKKPKKESQYKVKNGKVVSK